MSLHQPPKILPEVQPEKRTQAEVVYLGGILENAESEVRQRREEASNGPVVEQINTVGRT